MALTSPLLMHSDSRNPEAQLAARTYPPSKLRTLGLGTQTKSERDFVSINATQMQMI